MKEGELWLIAEKEVVILGTFAVIALIGLQAIITKRKGGVVLANFVMNARANVIRVSANNTLATNIHAPFYLEFK